MGIETSLLLLGLSRLNYSALPDEAIG